MSRDRTPFGQRMFESRTAARMTQVEVCSRLGISQGTLSEAERTAHSSTRVTDFAELYGVDAGWLATGRPAPSALEQMVLKELAALGIDMRRVRVLKNHRDLIGTLQEFGIAAPPFSEIPFVPDLAIHTPVGLVFVEVTGADPAEVSPEQLQQWAGDLPGELIVVGGGHSLFEGVKRIAELLPPESPSHRTSGVAQDMSLARPTLSHRKVAWEELRMGLTPDQPFELDVIDDALAPDIFTGCIAMMDPNRPPEPAWPVLVRDKRGDVYLRDYESGPGNSWRAVARARGFRDLDSEDDGLTILAAMEGYRRPRR